MSTVLESSSTKRTDFGFVQLSKICTVWIGARTCMTLYKECYDQFEAMRPMPAITTCGRLAVTILLCVLEKHSVTLLVVLVFYFSFIEGYLISLLYLK